MQLAFDYAQPFGPLTSAEGDVVCSAGHKCVSFRGNYRSPGYTHFVALTDLLPTPDKVHVFTLKLSGLVFEYGMNAIALVVMHPTLVRTCGEASDDRRVLSIPSQEMAPASTTNVTCVLSNSTLRLYTSTEKPPYKKTASGKRKRELENFEFNSYCIDRFGWQQETGGIYTKEYNLEKLQMKGDMPKIGVRMDSTLGNVVAIVPTPERVKAVYRKNLSDLACVTYE